VPFRAKVSGLLVLGSQLFSPHVRFDDHIEPEAGSNVYLESTVDSVLDFMQRFDPALKRYPVKN